MRENIYNQQREEIKKQIITYLLRSADNAYSVIIRFFEDWFSQ